jgi:hypothetical protein
MIENNILSMNNKELINNLRKKELKTNSACEKKFRNNLSTMNITSPGIAFDKLGNIDRRRTMLSILAITCTVLKSRPLLAKNDDTHLISVSDQTLAYEFSYPTRTTKGETLHLVYSRRPEKYSSAAPLSLDARKRIVCELVDLALSLTVSVTICPVSNNLKGKPEIDWKATELVEEALMNKPPTNKTKNSTRIVMDNIESIYVREAYGRTYWYYEHTSRASPDAIRPRSKENFRQITSVSTVRSGLIDGKPYIYTLNVSCPNSLWNEVKYFANEVINSFRLTQITKAYISPEKDPWLFI